MPTNPQPPLDTQPTHPHLDDLVRRIDLRYQLLYSKVAGVALTTWLAITILAAVALDGWIVATLTAIGALLFTLFAMRTVIHLTSKPLQAEVERFLADHDLEREQLLERARSLQPRPAEFFLSLVDGPLARQRRLREAAASSSRSNDARHTA